MKSLKLCVIVLVLSLSSLVSHAGFSFSPAVSHFSRSVEEGGVDQKTTFTYYDLRMGYTLEMGLYFGGLYSLVDESTAGSTSDYYFGPTIGYRCKGLNVLLTYLALGESDLDVGGIKYSGGTGFQLDLGYNLPITDSLHMGPMISMRNVEYKDREVQGLASESTRKVSSVTPYFAFWWQF